MTDMARLQRASRVFLAWLLIVYGASAPDMLRLMADELESLAAELATEWGEEGDDDDTPGRAS